jgi:hypothetical protein
VAATDNKKIHTETLWTSDGKVGGLFYPANGFWVKKIKGSVHILRRPHAIAVDAEIYAAVKDRLKRLVIIDTGKSHEAQKPGGDGLYVIDAPDFEKKKWLIQRGYGDQYACAVKEFRNTYAKPAVQLSLDEIW